jgi:hypothetical protein
MARLADDVFVGLSTSTNDPDDQTEPEQLLVGDLLTRLLQMDFDEQDDADDPDEELPLKAEEIVSLRVEQIRWGKPSVLRRGTVVPVSIARRNFSIPLRFGRPRERAGGVMVEVTLSGVDLHRVTPPCVVFTDAT